MNATLEKAAGKITVPFILEKKNRRERIACLTTYDYLLARILDETGIDILLVGDSLGMTRLGYESTLPVTVEEMMVHLKAARRAIRRALVVADMPYGSYHVDIKSAVKNALAFIKQGGAESVKIEGGRKRVRLVERLVEADIPVMGHIGLTPQSVNSMGGYKVQARTRQEADALLEDAVILQEAGAFSIVLEGIPQEVAFDITRELRIPTIGIGAGVHCDGQILVTEDLLGLSFTHKAKFVRQYANLKEVISGAVCQYIEDCMAGRFPGEEESYHLKRDTGSRMLGQANASR